MHAGSVALATNQPNAILSNPVGAQSITGQGLTLTASAPLTTQAVGTHAALNNFNGGITTTTTNSTGAGTHSGAETFTGPII